MFSPLKFYSNNIYLQWAEVLSADAFSAFEDAGLNDSKVGWNEVLIFIDLVLEFVYFSNVLSTWGYSSCGLVKCFTSTSTIVLELWLSPDIAWTRLI